MTHFHILRDHKPSQAPVDITPKSRYAGTIPCGCGCKEMIPACDYKGRPRTFVSGHAARVQHGDAWSEDQKNRFRTLWITGRTCKEIAAELSMPRNTVPGRASRLGLPGRGSPIKPKLDVTPEERLALDRDRDRKRRQAKSNVVKFRRAKSAPMDQGARPASNQHKVPRVRKVARMHVDTEPTQNLPIGAVSREVCAYPTSTEPGLTHSGLVHGFCGAKVEEGHSYCPGHAAICFVKSRYEEKEIAA